MARIAAKIVKSLNEFTAAIKADPSIVDKFNRMRVETMATTKDNGGSIKGRRVGKKRTVPKKKPVKPREQFAARLRLLVGERTTIEIGDLLGVSPNTVGKWLKGSRVPDLNEWPAIAKALGLDHWTDLLPR